MISRCCRTFSAIGDRQMFPRQTTAMLYRFVASGMEPA